MLSDRRFLSVSSCSCSSLTRSLSFSCLTIDLFYFRLFCCLQCFVVVVVFVLVFLDILHLYCASFLVYFRHIFI